ncbi:MAG TPA: hypothetical protein VFM02_04040 [Candidatus Paceibacterota bacterium]|nr:hypothetical protein [Candidatus Paceibacterota bacterium]
MNAENVIYLLSCLRNHPKTVTVVLPKEKEEDAWLRQIVQTIPHLHHVRLKEQSRYFWEFVFGQKRKFDEGNKKNHQEHRKTFLITGFEHTALFPLLRDMNQRSRRFAELESSVILLLHRKTYRYFSRHAPDVWFNVNLYISE